VLLEELGQLKIPLTSSVIEPAIICVVDTKLHVDIARDTQEF
jgi:hypothetical protein